MKKLLLVILLLIAIAMIFISINARILPPGLTGLGFILIAIMLYKKP
ncbi:hypothetical protein [Allomuricauda sp. ARW1Y1]|nr:hypothetical protein [Muricauda sp. ARW1Y1]NYJ27991.1 small-conductance mechanosensitive channel [Muricauda sp. ARW1Y1]